MSYMYFIFLLNILAVEIKDVYILELVVRDF
jgi:hypothetical protein